MASIIAQAEPKKLDNSIRFVPSVTEDDGYHVADNGQVRAEFHAVDNRVVFESRGRQITWRPEELKYVDAWGMEDSIYSVQDVPLETKANYARFNRTTPDADDWFIVENDRLKHQIIIQGFQRDPLPWLEGPFDFVISGKLSFDADLAVRADGMTLTGAFETSGGIEILDGDNVIFTLPRIIAKDSHFEKRAVAYGKYRVTANEGGVLAFDIVMDNEWIASEERVYPIVIDPTIISATTNHDTYGNGGRRLVRLSDNSIVACTYYTGSSDIYFYRSTDNGSTWVLLGTHSNPTTNGYPTIASSGVFVYFTHVNTNGAVYFRKFNATTQTGGSIVIDSYVVIDSGTNFAESGHTSIAISPDGTIGIVYVVKTSPNSASQNVRYLSSIDGGVTWAKEMVTTSNSSSQTFAMPNLLYKSNGAPVVIARFQSGTTTSAYGIAAYRKEGTSWVGSTSNVNGGSLSAHIQVRPTATIDPNDNIDVYWHARDAVDNSFSNIVHSRSTDGGVTWSAVTKLTSGNTYDQLDATAHVDSAGVRRVLFAGRSSGAYNQIRVIKYGAGGWEAPVNLTSSTTFNQALPSVLWSRVNANSADELRYIYRDGSVVAYSSISLNAPPLAPSALSRPNYDATTAATFTYQFNDTVGDTISAHEAEIVDTVTGTVVYTLAKTGTATTSFTVAANTLTNGKTYQWRVRTYDAGGLQSPWSAYASLKCAVAPQVAVTDPVASQIVSGDSYTVSGSYVQSAGSPQKSFRFRLYSATDVLLQDSGEIAGATNAKTFAGLVNNTTYKVDFTATSNDDITTTSAKVSFSVQYTPPATPTVTATNNSEAATVIVTFENPAPTGDQPSVSRNDVFRRKVSATDWTLIATGATSPYIDRTCPAGAYEYGVRAVATSGAVSEYGTAQVAHSFAGHRIVDEATGETLAFVYNVDGADITIEDDSQPVITFGGVFQRRSPTRYKRGTLSALYVDSAEDVMARVEALDRMAASDSLYLLKLSHGEAFKVSLSRVRYKAQHAGMTADVSVEWTKGGVE